VVAGMKLGSGSNQRQIETKRPDAAPGLALAVIDSLDISHGAH